MTHRHQYRWTYRSAAQDPTPEFQGTVKRLSDELGVPIILADILTRRGIDTYARAKSYFRPSLEDLHDPFLLKGMHTAVDRLVHALERNERIVVYGDYDVDGTNGTSLLWTFLKRVNADAHYFIPNRIREGYGLSVAGIDRVRELQPHIILAVDCGITSIQPVEYARSHGLDVIICDHHEPGEVLPDATAVLDPLIPGCGYPFKALCGAGVGFKLVQAMLTQNAVRSRLTVPVDSLLSTFLQYVTLATLADIVTLRGENRTIAKMGLELLNSEPVAGIKALIESSGLKPGKISSGQIVFVLAPRINAVGRLGEAMRAVELLTCPTYEDAIGLAQVLESENTERRRIDEVTFQQAQEVVERYFNLDVDSAIVLHGDGWHPGVIGIVASRLVERYYRPTIMMTTIDGVAKGSARSVSGFNIYEALRRCQDKLIQFGGHKYAAGLTVELDRIDEFREAFQAVASELLTEELMTPEIRIDADLDLGELTPKFVRVLSQFAPFGPENLRPVFATRNVEVIGMPRIVGRNHLRFKVKNNGHVVDAIGFNMGDSLNLVQPGRKSISLAFSLDEGEYGGDSFPQLKVRDIKSEEGDTNNGATARPVTNSRSIG